LRVNQSRLKFAECPLDFQQPSVIREQVMAGRPDEVPSKLQHPLQPE